VLKLVEVKGQVRVFETTFYYVVEQNKEYKYYNKLFNSLKQIKEQVWQLERKEKKNFPKLTLIK